MTSPSGLPRLLTLMGSGETSPTMVKVHRAILERLGPRPIPAVLLDTPFGFQENADELSIRVKHYFDESLQTSIHNASGIDPERPTERDRFVVERLTTNIQQARYVFSGPGSPTYALRKWEHTVVPQLLTEKLREGGAVTFASAAALTLGALTTPVYEIYKVGEDPRWLPGLNVMAEAGLHVAVIPHYNNAEGGTHDTRFCYLGERRLQILEEMMPEDTFVLGIDEHTSCTIDLDLQQATIGGIGVLTIRKSGQTTTFESGEVISIEQILECGLKTGHAATTRDVTKPRVEPSRPPVNTSNPLLDTVQRAERTFQSALDVSDAPGATSVMLDLEQSIHDWSTDSPGQDEMARARASLRSMINTVGQIAVDGLEDPVSRMAPYIDLLVSLRERARSDRRFEEADGIRDRLVSMGIELHDDPSGTTWSLRNSA